MQHTHDRRVSGVRRVPVERLVDVCGTADPASAFQGRSVDVSCRGMQVRASYLPQLHSPIVLRFHEHGAEVIAEGEVAWRRTATAGGDFGVRFTALDSRSVQALKALCGVDGLEEPDAHTQPGGAVAPISTRAPNSRAPGSRMPGSQPLSHPPGSQLLGSQPLSSSVTSSHTPSSSVASSSVASSSVASSRGPGSSRASSSRVPSSHSLGSHAPSSHAPSSSSGGIGELDHDTDPAPPAALGVRLHVAGLSSPLQARVKAQVSNRLELGSQLDFLRVGRALDVEDLAYGGKRTAYVEALDVSVDPKSGVPELVVSVRYADASDAAHSSGRTSTPEPQRARSLARGRSYWETEVPSSTPPPTTPRPAPERGRAPAPPELELSKTAEVTDGASDTEDERDTTPPPLPLNAERAERPAAAASKGAEQPSSKEPSLDAAARARSDEEEKEPGEVDSTEVILARLDSMLRGLPQAARAAGEQVVAWGGAASRGADRLLAQARRAMSASRRPAAPRRRTTAAPRSGRSGSLRQSSAQPAQQRPRTDEAADALRRRGTRTVMWSCLVALVAIGIGYLARPSRQLATPVAARVAAAPALPPASVANPSLARAATASDTASVAPSTVALPLAPSAALPSAPSASVAEEEGSSLLASDAPTGKRLPSNENLAGPSPARSQSVAAGSEEFGQGRLHLPVIYRLRLDEPGGTLRGERTATGFEITIIGRRVLDSSNANTIAKRDSRIAKVSTRSGAQGTRVSFRFRDEIPAYRVRLRRDSVEFLISSS